MYQLVYTSIIQKNLSAESVKALLLSSQAANAKNGITGCIVFYGNEFIHLLEGEKDNVLKLYARISLDSRHRHVTELYKQHVEERFFDDNIIVTDELSTRISTDTASFISAGDYGKIKHKFPHGSVAVKLLDHLFNLLIESSKKKNQSIYSGS